MFSVFMCATIALSRRETLVKDKDQELKKQQISPDSINLVVSNERVEAPTQQTNSKKKQDQLIGTVVGERYEILEILGRGATTSVYKAHDSELKRFVAIKILRSDSAWNEGTVRRFEQECKTLSLLKHSNIVSLYESGVTDSDQPYLVMEYVDGVSLKQLLEIGGSLDFKRALSLFIEVCAGLGAAHEKGIVHRDMKPANIMVTTDTFGQEHVKLLDFGVAKLLIQGETFQTRTQTGEMLGTLLYMSPEQFMEQDLDGRSDVYSVGCVLYETLTGKPPLCGKTALETMNKHMSDLPEPFIRVRPDLPLPKELDAIIQKCMAKGPQSRYPRIASLADDLTNLLAGKANLVTMTPHAEITAPVSDLTEKHRIETIAATCLVTYGFACWILSQLEPFIGLETLLVGVLVLLIMGKRVGIYGGNFLSLIASEMLMLSNYQLACTCMVITFAFGSIQYFLLEKSLITKVRQWKYKRWIGTLGLIFLSFGLFYSLSQSLMAFPIALLGFVGLAIGIALELRPIE